MACPTLSLVDISIYAEGLINLALSFPYPTPELASHNNNTQERVSVKGYYITGVSMVMVALLYFDTMPKR